MGKKNRKKKNKNRLPHKENRDLKARAQTFSTDARTEHLEAVAVPTTPEGKQKMYPRKLYPPPEVMRKMIEEEQSRMPANPLLRFFKVFFGEGY